MILGKGLDNIGNSAFEGCYELSDVYSYAEVVPQSNGNIFSSLDKSSTLHVPLSSINSYKSTEFGTAFGNIVPLTDSDPSPTGIKLIEKSIDEKVIIYDLNGRQIRQQQKGIYITNGKKLAVK